LHTEREGLPKSRDLCDQSALENFGVPELLKPYCEILPVSLLIILKDALTDKARAFVNESIREKILIHYKKEIPCRN
jgi:GTP-binding protein Era